MHTPWATVVLPTEGGMELHLRRSSTPEQAHRELYGSFAALDPENLRPALECVAKRARAVLAIAHP